MMQEKKSVNLSVAFATSASELREAQRLRYQVFVRELGGSGQGVNHTQELDCDAFDEHAIHLLLLDQNRVPGEQVVGVYRLLAHNERKNTLGFYSESEYDLSPLHRSKKRLLELGRSCVHPEYRGGAGLFLLWRAIAHYVEANGIDVLFGTASFLGADIEKHAPLLSLLHSHYLAPEHLRPTSKVYQPMGLSPVNLWSKPQMMRDMPPLIRSYLRLGGRVGDGAYVDREFNTVDVCMIVETQNITARHWQKFGVTQRRTDELNLAS